MLAALLLNLGAAPVTPPDVQARFGGGPFWKKYGYDLEEEKEEVIVDIAVSSEIIVEKIVSPNVDIVREIKPALEVIEAAQVQARAAVQERRVRSAELEVARVERAEARAAAKAVAMAAVLEAQRVEREALAAKLKAQREEEEMLLIAFMEL